jgi:hypothetical protein
MDFYEVFFLIHSDVTRDLSRAAIQQQDRHMYVIYFRFSPHYMHMCAGALFMQAHSYSSFDEQIRLAVLFTNYVVFDMCTMLRALRFYCPRLYGDAVQY